MVPPLLLPKSVCGYVLRVRIPLCHRRKEGTTPCPLSVDVLGQWNVSQQKRDFWVAQVRLNSTINQPRNDHLRNGLWLSICLEPSGLLFQGEVSRQASCKSFRHVETAEPRYLTVPLAALFIWGCVKTTRGCIVGWFLVRERWSNEAPTAWCPYGSRGAWL